MHVIAEVNDEKRDCFVFAQSCALAAYRLRLPVRFRSLSSFLAPKSTKQCAYVQQQRNNEKVMYDLHASRLMPNYTDQTVSLIYVCAS
jgi:hypothetical protein